MAISFLVSTGSRMLSKEPSVFITAWKFGLATEQLTQMRKEQKNSRHAFGQSLCSKQIPPCCIGVSWCLRLFHSPAVDNRAPQNLMKSCTSCIALSTIILLAFSFLCISLRLNFLDFPTCV